MKQLLFILILVLGTQLVFSQENGLVTQDININRDHSKKEIPLDSITNMYGGRYVDYKIINHLQDSIQIDTTLTIKKYHALNYTQKDDFELIGFANQGQGFNKLGYNFINNNVLPSFGATNKLYNYFKHEDINYFSVPTPTTILTYRSGLTGQFLDAIFTTNFSKHQNLSISFKGLRSTGDYQRSLASHTNFRTTYSYHNPEKRYQFRTYIVAQQLDNNENGGLTDTSIQEFKDDNPTFSVRQRIDVNLADSESLLKADRYFFEHELRLNNSDKVNAKINNLKLGHHISYEKLDYKFNSTDTEYFDANTSVYTYTNSETADKTEFSTTENQFYLKFNSPSILGDFKVFSNFSNIKQAYATAGISTPALEENKYTSAGANWNATIRKVFLNAYAEQIISGNNSGSNLHVNSGFKLKNGIKTTLGLQLRDAAVNNNLNFYQSNFSNFNWNNNFDNELYKTFYGNVNSKWGELDLRIHQIENFVYLDDSSITQQYDNRVDYLKLKFSNEFKFGKFTLNNAILYQKVTNGEAVFRAPEVTTRNTFYYTDYFFKGNPMLAQIGVSFKYFSKYYANEFNPVLNEFYLQNNQEIGDYPNFDVFINAEVRRTRIYFKVENATAGFTGRNYFTTNNQPGRDLTIRFGMVWNFWN
ncbi:putative porin [Flavobacteriaceae bacterium]|nr:putative porin [Flavobacteriaceae bacterium]